MDYSVDTPFRTYKEIQDAVKSNVAILSYDRSAAYHLACRVNPINTILNLLIPIISVLLMLLACVYFSITKWVLLFGILVLVIYTWVPHMKVLFVIIAIALIALPLFILNNSMWLLAIGVGIFGMLIGYYIWWGITAGIAHKALMANESLFESVWCSRKVALKTSSTIDGFFIYGCGKGSLQ